MMALIKKLLLILFVALFIVSCATKGSEIYSPHTSSQSAALENWSMTTLIAKGNEEAGRPLSYIVDGLDKADTLVLVSPKSDERRIKVEEGKVELINLLLGNEYTWRAMDGDGKTIKEGGFIVSEEPPRNIYVDGVTNVRDLGGWVMENGDRVVQGLAYRSGRLSENKSGEALITDKGIETLLSLGIKSEIDLRKTEDNENGGLKGSPLGEGVEYFSIPFETGGGYLQKNLSSFPMLFKVLGDRDNYPLLFHCSIGTDRTGAVSFVLLSLLSVSEDDLYRDYLFSNFGYIGGIRRKTAIDDYLLFIERYKGDSRKEKVYSMLVENGVDEKDIDEFISIMTDAGHLSGEWK